MQVELHNGAGHVGGNVRDSQGAVCLRFYGPCACDDRVFGQSGCWIGKS